MAAAAALAVGGRGGLAPAASLTRGEAIAWNGLLAYAASSYAWLMIRDPMQALRMSLLHSLQYLAVGWLRSQLQTALPELRLAGFYAVAWGWAISASGCCRDT